VRDAVGEAVDDERGVLGKPLRAIRVEPAAAKEKRVGEIPVEERDPGGNIGFEQFIDQLVVKIESHAIYGAGALRQHAGP
jgi:hypothetical protein